MHKRLILLLGKVFLFILYFDIVLLSLHFW